MPVIDIAGVLRAIGIRGAIAIALAIALGIALWRNDNLSEARDDAIRDTATEQASHAATRASLNALEIEVATFVQAGKLTREEAVDALVEAQDAGEELREAATEQNRTDWRGQDGL